MAPGVAIFKFVGTVSLGLLTGLSFTLSTVTVPTLLTLPSAQTAGKAFRTLTDAATKQLRALSGVATSAFLLAYLLSPRAVRHPYLLYTSLLVLTSRLATSEALAPYLYTATPSTAQPEIAPASPSRVHHMEASYEVLGSATSGSAGSVSGSVSDTHSDGADDIAGGSGAGVNGEEVRASVEVFLKRQIVRTVVSGLAFGMSIIGLWGDGTRSAVSETYIV
ncbi:hypothetical protein F503_03058 [Ophiostoma piceae UAMH 11346]|uniref:Autophagy-related protein 33 n=1 Tax=Ophiostoma piceae (strain UAMH 11346) TaxID=1262450 RepID=S3BYD5_OPHP1|nr:hypothetical protein F503_03058 [Ophiostoma piceae UAMH 11346]